MRTRAISVATALVAASALHANGQNVEVDRQSRADTQEPSITIAQFKTSFEPFVEQTVTGKIVPWLSATYTQVTNSTAVTKHSFLNVKEGLEHGVATFVAATNAAALSGECFAAINGINSKLDDVNRKLEDGHLQSPSRNDSVVADGSSRQKNDIDAYAPLLAAGGAILAALLALVSVIVVKGGFGSIKAKMDTESAQRMKELDNVVAETNNNLKKAFDDADLKSVKTQVAFAKMSATTIEGKVLALDRDLREQPAKLDAIGKTFSREAENQRRAIMDALFGRGRDYAGDAGLVPQIDARLTALEKAILSAVTTERELLSRKANLDVRENRLTERERNVSAELAAAREEGAADAMKKVTALEATDESLRKAFGEMQARLSERNAAQSQEFGKRLAALEAERDNAVATSRKAEAEAAGAERRATAAEQTTKKIKNERDAALSAHAADVARLNEEIRSRDEARDSEIAKACESIRVEVETANAATLAKLTADVQSAREDREKCAETARRAAEESARTIESLRATGAATEKALASVKAALDAEKSARAAENAEAAKALADEKAAASQKLADEKAAHDSDCKKAEAREAELVAARDAARSRLFPAEFASDSRFGPLIESLDDLDARKLPGASLARAALTIFAERKNLPDKIWLRALGDFSLGLATALDADGGDAVAALAKWKSVLDKIGVAAPSFSLRLPAIGSKVDIAWMHSRAGVSTVRKVRSWAVFGSAGNAYMAEVE